MSSTTPQQGRSRPSRQPTLNEIASPADQQTSPQASTTDTQSRSLNKPRSRKSSSTSTAAADASVLTPSQDSSPPNEPRTCWICQQDDTEDTPDNNIWRTPCPCSLTAHDSCLLEWIANEESPKPGELGHNRKIVCPQCQVEIKIQRPRALLVSAVDNIHRVAKKMMLPAAASAALGCVYSGLLVYGINAMGLVFGIQETGDILAAGVTPGRISEYKRLSRALLHGMDPFFPASEHVDYRYFFAFPMIGPALVLLRTSIADQYLPLLSPFYFIKPSHRNLTWPPSPGLAFAAVPYIRVIYKELYSHTFSALEKKWELAVQRKPREGETAEQIAAAAREADQEGNAQAIFEIEWGNAAEEEEEVVEEVPPFIAALNGIEAEARANAQPNIQAQGAPPAVDGAENEGVGPQPNPPRRRHNHGPIERQVQDIEITSLASTVLGALFFPAISSVMGTLLKYTLPTHITSSTVIKQGGFLTKEVMSKGILKEKWGRSLVGGCLFVVLKDAVVLYCKWKKAKDFGKRRVLDYVGKKDSSAR